MQKFTLWILVQKVKLCRSLLIWLTVCSPAKMPVLSQCAVSKSQLPQGSLDWDSVSPGSQAEPLQSIFNGFCCIFLFRTPSHTFSLNPSMGIRFLVFTQINVMRMQVSVGNICLHQVPSKVKIKSTSLEALLIILVEASLYLPSLLTYS